MLTSLVAGGSGFIGSHLCKRLLQEGHNVICVDNLITGNKKNIENLLGNDHFTFFDYDVVKSLDELKSKLQSVDFIYHLASPASPNKNSPRSYINYPIETLSVNSQGTHNLLKLAHGFDAKFLYASSSEIYGDPLESPQKESYFGNVNPNGIRSVYDEGKRFGEAISFAYHRKYNVDIRVIRIFNTYGPFMLPDDGRVVSNFIMQALHGQAITIYGKGEQTRSFCYVDDLVEGLFRAMTRENTNGEVMNLGNPDERSISQIATIIKDMTNSGSEIVHEDLPEDDPKNRKPSIEKAKGLLAWEPRVLLEEGLLKTISYFQQL